MAEQDIFNVYFTTIVKKNIILNPNLQNKNINETILKILQKEVEGKCIEEGFVKPGSIVISKRSLPKLTPNTFGGSVKSEVRFKADVCSPIKGNVIECTVEKINKMGLMAKVDPLNIIVPRSFHNNKDIFKDIEIGSKIKIEVIGRRYEINWDHIDVIGSIYIPEKATSKSAKSKPKIKIIDTEDSQKDVLEDMSDNEMEEPPNQNDLVGGFDNDAEIIDDDDGVNKDDEEEAEEEEAEDAKEDDVEEDDDDEEAEEEDEEEEPIDDIVEEVVEAEVVDDGDGVFEDYGDEE